MKKETVKSNNGSVGGLSNNACQKDQPATMHLKALGLGYITKI